MIISVGGISAVLSLALAKDEMCETQLDTDIESSSTETGYNIIGTNVYIYDTTGLYAFAGLVNSGNGFEGYTVTLMSRYYDLSYSVTKKSWTPIGTQDKPFRGSFNGNYAIIDNMNVSGNYMYAGFFGKVTPNATSGNQTTFKNLYIQNATISVNRSNGTYAGGFIGALKATIDSNSEAQGRGNVEIFGIYVIDTTITNATCKGGVIGAVDKVDALSGTYNIYDCNASRINLSGNKSGLLHMQNSTNHQDTLGYENSAYSGEYATDDSDVIQEVSKAYGSVIGAVILTIDKSYVNSMTVKLDSIGYESTTYKRIGMVYIFETFFNNEILSKTTTIALLPKNQMNSYIYKFGSGSNQDVWPTFDGATSTSYFTKTLSEYGIQYYVCRGCYSDSNSSSNISLNAGLEIVTSYTDDTVANYFKRFTISDSIIAITAQEIEGYNFLGWYLSNSNSIKYGDISFDSTSTTLNLLNYNWFFSDKYVCAIYQEKTKTQIDILNFLYDEENEEFDYYNGTSIDGLYVEDSYDESYTLSNITISQQTDSGETYNVVYSPYKFKQVSPVNINNAITDISDYSSISDNKSNTITINFDTLSAYLTLANGARIFGNIVVVLYAPAQVRIVGKLYSDSTGSQTTLFSTVQDVNDFSKSYTLTYQPTEYASTYRPYGYYTSLSSTTQKLTYSNSYSSITQTFDPLERFSSNTGNYVYIVYKEIARIYLMTYLQNSVGSSTYTYNSQSVLHTFSASDQIANLNNGQTCSRSFTNYSGVVTKNGIYYVATYYLATQSVANSRSATGNQISASSSGFTTTLYASYGTLKDRYDSGGSKYGNLIVIFYNRVSTSSVTFSSATENVSENSKFYENLGGEYSSSESVDFEGSIHFYSNETSASLHGETKYTLNNNLTGVNQGGTLNNGNLTVHYYESKDIFTDTLKVTTTCNSSEYSVSLRLTFSDGNYTETSSTLGGSAEISTLVLKNGATLKSVTIFYLKAFVDVTLSINLLNPDGSDVTLTSGYGVSASTSNYSVTASSQISWAQGFYFYYKVSNDYGYVGISKTSSNVYVVSFKRSYTQLNLDLMRENWNSDKTAISTSNFADSAGNSITFSSGNSKISKTLGDSTSGSNAYSSSTFYWREKITLTANATTGFTFDGWYNMSDNSLVSSETNYTFSLNGSSTYQSASGTITKLYARFVYTLYSVTINKNTSEGAYEFYSSYSGENYVASTFVYGVETTNNAKNNKSGIYTDTKKSFSVLYGEKLMLLNVYSGENYTVTNVALASNPITKSDLQTDEDYSVLRFASNAGTVTGSGTITLTYVANWNNYKTTNSLTFENGVLCEISSAEELARLAYEVNYNGQDYSGKIFRLTNNIDTLTHMFDSIGKNNYTYYSLGQSKIVTVTNAFAGVFDGNGYKISGLNFNSYTYYKGLFGYTNGAEIKALYLETSTILGGNYNGALVGFANNTVIEHIAVLSGSVEGNYNGTIAGKLVNSTLSECLSKGLAVGTAKTTGLFVGYSENSTISELQNYGTSSSSFVGTGTYTNNYQDTDVWFYYKNVYYLTYFFWWE